MAFAAAQICRAAPAPADISALATPPRRRLRPLTALGHVRELLQNKEDTSQVFHITRALSGGSEIDTFARFMATPYGRRVAAGEVDLAEDLADREPLRRLPEGTYGRVYADFMDREGLTPDGVNQAASESAGEEDVEQFRRDYPELMRLFRHLNASHDLWHVLTGYGRDALGEIALLAYTYRMTGNLGIRAIVFFGGRKYAREAGVPTGRVIQEGLDLGARSAWIPGEDLPGLFALPIAEARARMKLGGTPVYDAIPADVKLRFGKPEEEMKAAAAAEPALA